MSLFYLFYRILMHNDTWFSLRRTVLLLSLALSMMLPFCIITIHKFIEMPLPYYQFTYMLSHDSFPPDISSRGLEVFTSLMSSIIIVGIGVMTLHFIMEIVKLNKITKGLKWRKEGGIYIGVTNKPTSPFSFLNYVVLSDIDYKSREHLLIEHELQHIRHHHTLDLLFIELLIILQWFNPIIWLTRKEIRMVHEYEADEHIINSIDESRSYLKLLMEKATQPHVSSIANTFSDKSNLKHRFTTLARPRSSKWCKLKSLFIIIIIGLSLLTFSRAETEYIYKSRGHNNIKSFADASINPIIKTSSIDNSSQKDFDLIAATIQNGPESDSVLVYKSSTVSEGKNQHYHTGKIEPVRILEDKESLSSLSETSEKDNTITVALEDTILKELDYNVLLLTSNSKTDEINERLSIARSYPTEIEDIPLDSSDRGFKSVEYSVSNGNYLININAYKIELSSNEQYIIIQNNKTSKTEASQPFDLSADLTSSGYMNTTGIQRLILTYSN